MGRPSRFSPEVRERAVRLVLEQRPAAEPSGPCRSPPSRPVPAISRLWGLPGRPPAVLHATLVADAFLAARPERPLHFVSVRTYASG